MARTPRTTTRVVYQIKVTLKGSKPPIWRRMQITSDITLVQLHRIVQCVMGWEGSHLYQFVIGGIAYGDPGMVGEWDIEDARTVPLQPWCGVRRPSFSMSTISGIAGNTSSSWKRYCRWTRGSATLSASRANGPVPPRIVVVSGDTPVSWTPSTIQSTPSTRRCENG